MYDPDKLAEKYRLAREAALVERPQGGVCGLELEWNLLDEGLRPLLTVGSGPSRQSFVDFLRAEALSPWLKDFSQLEVFHWMIEWATRPYYSPRGAVYEGRLLEATLLNALARAGKQFDEQLCAWHGNLLFNTQIGPESIPGSWHIAKRRYLERCVDLYGDSLATAGNHANISLPDPLFAWDFLHINPTERGDTYLDEYKSEYYITATRLMRAFAALFIACNASTPMQAQVREGRPVVVLTEYDSVRNLIFPNPAAIDLPDLYRSYQDYLHISYDLVRRGVRFGNNNWTPVRARSFAEPVERLIATTSEQLDQLYSRGLYALGEDISVDGIAAQIEIQNLMARINLPMSRVEVRTDDGGHSLEVEIANLTLKHLLMLRFYGDATFGRAFRYDHEDIERARRNEIKAAQYGLRAEIENPFSGKPVTMAEFLDWTLQEVMPLAKVLELSEDLEPLVAMAGGSPNTAGLIRMRLRQELNGRDEIPLDLLRTIIEERAHAVAKDAAFIAENAGELGADGLKLSEYLQRVREDVRNDPFAPVRFRPRPEAVIDLVHLDKTGEILNLAKELIRIPSVTASPDERLDEVRRCATLIFDFGRDRGLGVRYYNEAKYPALLIGFPGQMNAPVMLVGHFDVVEPEPDDSQFNPRVEGDYLWGRGAADMKTVVATFLVWMKDRLSQGEPYPPVNLLLVGNEENGESEAMGTPHVLRILGEEDKYHPQFVIAGERTEEIGDRLWGEVCTENRGIMRFEIEAHGLKGHSGVTASQPANDITERLLAARQALSQIMARHLTLSSSDGWKSQARFPFIQVGNQGIYNITADRGVMGVEVRPIPGDHINAMAEEVQAYCQSHGLDLQVQVMESGIACNPTNPYLQALLQSIKDVSGETATIGKKLPGTSARFAPGGQGVVWGQSGVGPHSAGERHFIPSILPYYRALDHYGEMLAKEQAIW